MLGNFRLAQIQIMPIASGANMLRFVTRQCGCEELTKRIECIAPGVALILNKSMEHGNADRLTNFPPVFQGSGEWRDAREFFFRQKVAQFNFRMDARLHAAVDLQYEPIAK